MVRLGLLLGLFLLLVVFHENASHCLAFTPLVQTCRCGHGPQLCSIKDIVSITRPDPTWRQKRYFVTVLNNCLQCQASWVAVRSSIPGYPTLLKGGAALNPWEMVEVGPNPGPPIPHPPTQVNFTCIRHP
ncbi:hypothetical protein GOP47_0017751 [Adiantum capillus-veneris]|uniref:Uncharacterized protein n=1 Tax=Adiantum capillus-veneris TaxID=13818 RepID=A0A9D4Z9H2_ADICA|nr:hypothetical protein GOP47_0017751 [Adiantum capillus-veneris]